jgi:diacylglycerol kinase (ATP)
MKRIVLINRRARGIARAPHLVEAIERACRGRAQVVATHHASELSAALERLAQAPDEAAIVGGDGSFMEGITSLREAFGHLPRLALVGAGTVSRVARTHGAMGGAVRSVRAWLEAGGEECSLDSLLVSATHGPTSRERVGFLFGAGLVSRFFERYVARGAGGLTDAARIAGRVFVESFWSGPFARSVLDPVACRLRVDGHALPGDAYSLVCAAVVRDLGLGLRVTYRAGEAPGYLHLVASRLPAAELGPRAPRVLAGMTIGGDGHVDRLVEAFEVELGPRGAIVLDGDLLPCERARVSAGPPLRLWRPVD